jgi:hypothetical protein
MNMIWRLEYNREFAILRLAENLAHKESEGSAQLFENEHSVQLFGAAQKPQTLLLYYRVLYHDSN